MWGRMRDLPLPGTSCFRRGAHCPFLIELPHDGFTWLVAVIPPLKFPLLFHLSGITIF